MVLKTKRCICYLITIFLVTGCQTPQQSRVSRYKEVSKVDLEGAAFREINICRDGSLSDNAVLEIFLDGEFAGWELLARGVPKSVDGSTEELKSVLMDGGFEFDRNETVY